MKNNVISDEDFKKALNDVDNKKIIKTVLSKFDKYLDLEERKSCGLIGLWRCLQGHKSSFNRKFTSSLWNFVKWACINEVKKKYRHTYISLDDNLHSNKISNNKICMINELKDSLNSLNPELREVVEEYYFGKYTLEEIGKHHGYSGEYARQKIQKGIKELTKIYM